MPEKYERIGLARSVSSRTRQPSFSTRTQTLYSSFCLMWNRAKEGFEDGYMGAYELRMRYSDFVPCPAEICEMILAFCATNASMWENPYQIGIVRRTVLLPTALLGFERNVHRSQFSGEYVTQVTLLYETAGDGSFELRLHDQQAFSFIQGCKSWDEKRVAEIVYG